jgi:hypothetical protein
VALCIQTWDVEASAAGDMKIVHLQRRTWAALEEQVQQQFSERLAGAPGRLFALYYIHDPSSPLLSRSKVHDQSTLEEYISFRFASVRNNFLNLYLHVAVLLNPATRKPVSPVKPPLSIDTALARAQEAHIGVQQAASPRSSSSHLSPDSVTSPLSPGSPREKEFRQVVLARDSDGNVRPDEAVLQAPAAVFRCVFCADAFLPKLIKGAHVVPHSERERLGLDLEVTTLLRIGGVESLSNGLSACNNCHEEFDEGLVWVEQDSHSTPPTIFVRESIRAVQLSIGRLHGQPLRRPADASFPFPSALAFQWRKQWAALKREKTAESVADKLAQLAVGGTCSVCTERALNKACKKNPKLCAQCCRSAGGCSVHRLQAAGSSAAATAAANHPFIGSCSAGELLLLRFSCFSYRSRCFCRSCSWCFWRRPKA